MKTTSTLLIGLFAMLCVALSNFSTNDAHNAGISVSQTCPPHAVAIDIDKASTAADVAIVAAFDLPPVTFDLYHVPPAEWHTVSKYSPRTNVCLRSLIRSLTAHDLS
jgi:hypothetical protein